MNQIGRMKLSWEIEEGSRITKDRRFIIELRDKAMNRILLLYMQIKNKNSVVGIRRSSGRGERIFFISLLWSGGWA